MVEIREYYLPPTDLVPNSPRPVLHYKNVLPRNPDNPAHCSQLDAYDTFQKNGWEVQWLVRYGQTQLSHFHSRAHEAMAVLSGHATIRLGVGDTSEDLQDNTYGTAYEKGGLEVKAVAGDVFLIPAGVAHKSYDPRPDCEFKRLTGGSGHGIGDGEENPRQVLSEIELSGFTMMGAYYDGQWDFAKAGGDYEKIWSTPKPKLDPVFGDAEEGLKKHWCGSNIDMRVE